MVNPLASNVRRFSNSLNLDEVSELLASPAKFFFIYHIAIAAMIWTTRVLLKFLICWAPDLIKVVSYGTEWPPFIHCRLNQQSYFGQFYSTTSSLFFFCVMHVWLIFKFMHSVVDWQGLLYRLYTSATHRLFPLTLRCSLWLEMWPQSTPESISSGSSWLIYNLSLIHIWRCRRRG